VKVAARFRSNGAWAANEAAVQGLGIANAPLWQVRSLLDRGAVELVFDPLRAAAGAGARSVAINEIIAGKDPIICRIPRRPPKGRASLIFFA
jgi:DNA-binding transcriptional LysR family regulator